MTFRTEFHECYALELVKEKVGEFLPPIIRENRQYLKIFEQQEVPFWPYISDQIREFLLAAVSPYCDILLALDPDETTDVIIESLAENRLKSTFKKGWIKANLMAFRQDLETTVSS